MNEPLTATETALKLGLKVSLIHITKRLQIPFSTFVQWHEKKPLLFTALIREYVINANT